MAWPQRGKPDAWKCEVVCSMDQPVKERPPSYQQTPQTWTIFTRRERQTDRWQPNVLIPTLLALVCEFRLLPPACFYLSEEESAAGIIYWRWRLRFWRSEGKSQGGADADSHFRFGDITLPRHPLFHQGKQSLLFAHEPACHWIFIMYLIRWGGSESHHPRGLQLYTL